MDINLEAQIKTYARGLQEALSTSETAQLLSYQWIAGRSSARCYIHSLGKKEVRAKGDVRYGRAENIEGLQSRTEDVHQTVETAIAAGFGGGNICVHREYLAFAGVFFDGEQRPHMSLFELAPGISDLPAGREAGNEFFDGLKRVGYRLRRGECLLLSIEDSSGHQRMRIAEIDRDGFLSSDGFHDVSNRINGHAVLRTRAEDPDAVVVLDTGWTASNPSLMTARMTPPSIPAVISL